MKRGVISVVLAMVLALQALASSYSAMAATLADCAAEETRSSDCPCCADHCPGAGCDCMTPLFSGTVLALTGGGLQVFFAPLTGGSTEFRAGPLASQTYAPLHPPPIR